MPEIVSSPLTLILVGLCAYLLGSVPFGVLISRALGLGDLRRIGSGNIGATNVLRTGNKSAAAATLLLDGGKGVVAVLLARLVVGEDAAQIAALGAFLGHLFPIYLGFRGGKGVATFLGILLALAWPVGLTACATWLLTAALFRYSSAAALVSAASAPLWALAFGYVDMTVLITLLAALIFHKHKPNILRLVSGTEPKIGSS